jgi:hypothetical protein
MTTQIARPPLKDEGASSWLRADTAEDAPRAFCPLCGSALGRACVTTNAISLVECPTCMRRGTFFWMTAQAGEDAARLRADGHIIDPQRVRELLDLRADEGGPALVRCSDMKALLSS